CPISHSTHFAEVLLNLSAVIVAGGKGTRLASVVGGLPKAMVPIGGRPLIDHSLNLLRRYGFNEVVICLGYLGDQICSYVQEGAKWDLRVRYSEDTVPLGTAGCLKAIDPGLSNDFLVLYADVLAELDLASLTMAHNRSGADATLVVHPNNHPYD